ELETLATDTSILTDEVIELDGPHNVTFQTGENEGVALAVPRFRFGNELIDLRSGNRSRPSPLVVPEGGEFNAVWAMSDGRGFLAIEEDGRIARWADGEMAEQVRTGGVRINRYAGHARGEDRLAVAVALPDGSSEVHYVDTTPGQLDILATVEGPMVGAHVTLDEFSVLGTDGVLRTYDPIGRPLRDVDVGLLNDTDRWDHAVSPDSGLVAFGGSGGVVLVDPRTGRSTRVPTFGSISGLSFARDGRILVIGDRDGVVRLWDVADGVSRGVLVRTGERIANSGWYDEETDSVWIASGTRLLRLPLSPDDFLERACDVLDRELTQQEWDNYVGLGGGVRSVCR
ncbi:MAG: WD40 repeat domain-containing protein, partial [Actinomycetota bacterium]